MKTIFRKKVGHVDKSIEDNIIDRIKSCEYMDFLQWLINTDQEYIIEEFLQDRNDDVVEEISD